MPKIWCPSDDVLEWLRGKYAYEDGRIVVRATGAAAHARTSRNGYFYIRITNLPLGVRKYIAVHHLAWFLHHGVYPKTEIDHRDHDKSNNDVRNLREATHAQNHMNGGKKKSRTAKPFTSRFKGVSWNRRDQRWHAFIGLGGKSTYLGQFTDEEAAARAYDAAARAHYGEFANVNFTSASPGEGPGSNRDNRASDQRRAAE